MFLIASFIHWAFFFYTLLILASVMGSWFPKFEGHPIMLFAREWTEPYLALFRRIIPPIDGSLDLSPILGFFFLQIVEHILLRWIL